jgi:CHAT domain-containing protein
VHGAAGSEEAGGFLLLSGPAPRLTSSEIGKVRLKPGARVVLAACESASPGGRLPWAFVRAGAGAVLAASGEVDDAAAARWTGSFTAALARGASTARANQEALEQEATQPAGSARAWFVLYR